MLTPNAARFDAWIRTPFCETNTELETLYANAPNRLAVADYGHDLKAALCREGRVLIQALLREGNTDEGFANNFDLLGNVGFYMAACARHQITPDIAGEAAHQREATALALQLGAGIGVAPRFVSSHLMTHNRAYGGVYKRFTSLPDERLFIDHNTLGVLAYTRASQALMHIQPLGISHPVVLHLFDTATAALGDVIANNQVLYNQLDANQFFYHVRPYYKPHKVGTSTFRGANAGDFAGINVIDLLLGLCMPDQAFYSQLLVDKLMYIMPGERLVLRDVMRQKDLLTQFLECADAEAGSDWFQRHAAAFLRVCQAHGQTALQHHNQLVKRFIEHMAEQLPAKSQQGGLTASGPPLPVLLRSLEILRDMRTATPRDDVNTRFQDMATLRALVQSEPAGQPPALPSAG